MSTLVLALLSTLSYRLDPVSVCIALLIKFTNDTVPCNCEILRLWRANQAKRVLAQCSHNVIITGSVRA